MTLMLGLNPSSPEEYLPQRSFQKEVSFDFLRIHQFYFRINPSRAYSGIETI